MAKREVKKPSDFKLGEVYKMHLTDYCHVAKPYYVYIKEIGENYIITDIPNFHSLKIYYGNNWDYQTKRMEYMGTDMKLVKNQTMYYKNNTTAISEQ